MKTLLYLLGGLLVLEAGAQQLRKSFSDQQVIPLKAGTKVMVIVENTFGPVRIKSGAESEISYKVEKTYFGDNQGELDWAVKEIQMGSIFRNDSLILYVKSPCSCSRWEGDCVYRGWSWRDGDYDFRFDFDLTIPASAALNVSTVDKGNVLIEGIHGEIRANNVNGNVSIKGARYVSRAGTISGDVEVFYEDNPLMDAEFSNISGNIDLYFKENAGAQVYTKSLSGELYSAFDYVTIPPKLTKVVQKDDGETTYSINNQSGIAIGKNGPTLVMETISGNMYLRKL